MRTCLVMTVLGRDEPGLVDRLASVLARHHGNWLESHMAHLGGQFAGILRVEIPADQEGPLADSLRSLADQGIAVVSYADASPALAPAATRTSLELVGQDRPGIVRSIYGALARHGVNVEELETSCESAPMTGETLFRARAQLHVPADCDHEALRRELERIAGDLMVDLQFDA